MTCRQKKYNVLSFPLQCRILDVAQAYVEAKDCFALIALDWSSGTSQLLALDGNREALKNQAIGFLDDPLTLTMVDPTYEPEKHHLLEICRHLLQTDEKEEQCIGLYTVTCSEEFYVNNLFIFPLDCSFSLELGKSKDDHGRLLPESIFQACEETLF